MELGLSWAELEDKVLDLVDKAYRNAQTKGFSSTPEEMYRDILRQVGVIIIATVNDNNLAIEERLRRLGLTK